MSLPWLEGTQELVDDNSWHYDDVLDYIPFLTQHLALQDTEWGLSSQKNYMIITDVKLIT